MAASRRLVALLSLVLVGCGGGGGGTSSTATASATGTTTTTTTTVAATANVQSITVNSGPTNEFPNSVLTSVTICVPGTSTCQTIPNVQVDTGSTGLRLLASVVTIPLPGVASGASGTYNECAAFADGVTWGSLASADVKLAGEVASGLSVQLIRDNASSPAVPASCSAQGTPEDTLALLGTNGIIGVGVFIQDCGSYCASSTDAMYYACSATGACAESTISLAQQVSNPVAFFATDNNGVILQLPAISANGVASETGNMIFGIGTQTDNVLTGTVINVASTGVDAGAFTAIYKGVTLADSFFDSGSSALYFDDPSLPICASSTSVGDLSGFYCPGSTAALSATPISVTVMPSNGSTSVVTASVANALYLFTQPGADALNAFNDLAGPAGATLPDAFDFGVPFFFGRSVFTAFEQRTTPSGSGPYYAYQAYP